MSKAILLSVRPYWAYLIWKLLKTLELRKIVPKFINSLVYIYVTIRPQDLKKIPEEHREMVKSWMGKVPMRFWFDEYDKLLYVKDRFYKKSYEWSYKQQRQSCLTDEEIHLYGEGKDLYAWHIKNLEIFDKPKALREFYTWNESYEQCPFAMNLAEEYMTTEEILVNRGSKTVTRPTQSYQYVYVKEK